MKYAELHAHTVFSPLDGIGTSAEYAARCKEIGIDYLAQTDHGTNAGHREHQRACKEAGVIPILGNELYFSATDRFDRRSPKQRKEEDDLTPVYNHLTALSLNEKGLKNLNNMLSESWESGFYSHNRVDMELLEQYNEGLAILSGCLSGPICKSILNEEYDKAERFVQQFKSVFGERFFIELMTHNPISLNRKLMEYSKKYNVPAVVTSDCHHVRKEDLWVQEAMLIISSNPKKNNDFDFSKSQKMDYLERFNYVYPERKMTFEKFGIHLNSWKEHMIGLEQQGFGSEVISNTMLVAEMVDHEDYPYYNGLDLLPRPVENENDTLREMAENGLKEKVLFDDPVYKQRLEEELEVIFDKDFSIYFIICADAIQWGKAQGILFGPARGSAAGSLLCYATGITEVDPIVHKTLFFRFLSPDRLGWPDIDVDVQDSRRHELKQYLIEKYKHVGNIATFTIFNGKGIVRDASRAFSVPLGEVNAALKLVDSWEGFLTSTTTQKFRSKYPEVVELGKRLHGKVRNVGMHAGGLVMSREPLSNYVPTQTATDPRDKTAPRVPYVAVDMREAEEIGLIKYDWLGLKTLSVIADTLKLVKERHGVDIPIYDLGWDDPDVYEDMSKGYTKMLFQAEQTAYTKMLLGMDGIKNFDELVASNALVRPGASKSSFGAMYINGKNSGHVTRLHKDVDHHLETTYGAVLYQEQTMQLCVDLAGMTHAESEHVRKAIGKKQKDKLELWGEKFIQGAKEKIGEQRAIALWDDILASSEYSFNLSHAVAYSMLTYATAWLKRHYTIEFITSALSHEKDKDFIADYLIEAKRMGLSIMLPHVNKSGIDFSIYKDENGKEHILFGLANIKFISSKLSSKLINMRPFDNYEDLQSKAAVKGSGISTRVIASLNKVGAARFEDNEVGDIRPNLFEYLNIPAFDTTALDPQVERNMTPLAEYSEDGAYVVTAMVRKLTIGPTWSRVEMVDSTGSASVFADADPGIETGRLYVMLIAGNRLISADTLEDFTAKENKGFKLFLSRSSQPEVPQPLVRVVSFNSRKTKAGKNMATMVVADEFMNLYPVTVFSNVYFKAHTNCKPGMVVDLKLKDDAKGYILEDVL